MTIDRMGRLEPPILVPVIKPTIGLPWYKQLREAVRSRTYMLREPWHFYDGDGNICMIPAAYHYRSNAGWLLKDYRFITDGTSWPRPFQIVFDKMGIGLTSGMPHDFAIRYQVFLDCDGKIKRTFKTRKEADDEYRRIDERVNGMPRMSKAKWAGVRAGSWIAWNRYRKMPPDQTDPLLLL